MIKRQPQRTCMGCNTKKDKKDLILDIKISEEIYENLRGVILGGK